MDISESMRKLIMAGIGAISTAADKSQELLEQLAQKGEEAVRQGDVMNELLHRDTKQTADTKEAAGAHTGKSDVLNALKGMTAQERSEILDQLRRMNAEDSANDP